jgi:hypothetical protein
MLKEKDHLVDRYNSEDNIKMYLKIKCEGVDLLIWLRVGNSSRAV